jgi:hypothetical protein
MTPTALNSGDCICVGYYKPLACLGLSRPRLQSNRTTTFGPHTEVHAQSTMARTPSDTENNSGKKPEEALDLLSELADFLYVYNTANQAHTHTRTTKAIAEFAGRTVSKNMKILIKRSQEATFTKPVLQTSGAATSTDPDGVSTRAESFRPRVEHLMKMHR